MSEMISVAAGFQYSVNIEYDWNDDGKIQNFIPTNAALSLLEEILSSTDVNSTSRARVLVGAYGRGKSHIVLMILSMLMHKPKALFKNILLKLDERPILRGLIENYYDGGTKILPVAITGSSNSLTQSFLLALRRALANNNLSDAMPDTNYKAALAVIDRWKRQYPETYAQLQAAVEEPVTGFIERLENFDLGAYQKFERVYPQLTAGSEFNPFLNFDVVELYESVARSLKRKGYAGLYVVYDEFGKYLEANIDKASVSDTKMLQDFAEKCNRSGALQMHLMLISHKEIANYIDKLPKQKIDGWRGISERFRHVHLNDNFTQVYELISSVIQRREPAWKKFCNQFRRAFDGLLAQYGSHRMFSDSAGALDMIVERCYPLHPVSTFILPRLSEKIAQNERTLFTFLSADGTSTLPSFLRTFDDKTFRLITPDQIFDYFEPLLRKEIYSSEVHKIYLLASNILQTLSEEPLGSKIVKTIALIYMLEQFERLQPTKAQLSEIYSKIYDDATVARAIDELIDKDCVIYLKRSNDYLKLKPKSDVDIRRQIRDRMEHRSLEPKEALNDANVDNYLYPYRYNDEHEMVRYFSFRFIDGAEIDRETDWDLKSEAFDGDGIIYGILPRGETDRKNLIELLEATSRNCSRYIFVVPNRYENIDGVLAEYQAVTALRDEVADDPVLFDEYEIIRDDLSELIKAFINTYTHPEKFAAAYIHAGARVPIKRKAELTELMSAICDEIYSKTPVINNEALNRNEITAVAANSRQKIIGALLRNELESDLGFKNTTQEASIMRSTLINTGVLINGAPPRIDLNPHSKNMAHVTSTVEQFIRRSARSNFDELYRRLTAPKYGIGLRRGLIPIYIAAALHEHRPYVVIKEKDEQVPLNADTLARIDAQPKDFSIEYLDWDDDREMYVESLKEIFSEHITEFDRSYDQISNAMRRWFLSLPKYARDHKSSAYGVKLIKLLRQNIGSAELLFKKIPELFGDDTTLIRRIKNEYDGSLRELERSLIAEMKVIFAADGSEVERMSLTSILKDWLETLDKNIFEQLFNDGTEKFLIAAQSVTNDEEAFITRAARLATDLRLEDWNDETRKIFIETIEQYKKTAEAFGGDAMAETGSSDGYRIVFADGSIKQFEKTEMTPRGKLLLNQITDALASMGRSITVQEKRQILLEAFKTL